MSDQTYAAAAAVPETAKAAEAAARARMQYEDLQRHAKRELAYGDLPTETVLWFSDELMALEFETARLTRIAVALYKAVYAKLESDHD